MITYLFVLLFLIVAVIFNKKVLFYGAFLLLFFVSAFRDFAVGTDVVQYQYYFDYIKAGNTLWTEPLWNLLNELVVIVNGDFRLLIVFSSLLVLMPLFYVFNKTGKYRNLCVLLFFLLYYYFYSFNIIRQSIACSFLLLGYYFLSKESKKKYFISILVAFLFHKTAIFALLILFFYKKEYKKNIYFFLLFISIVVGIFFIQPIIDLALRFYPNYENIELKGNIAKSLLNLLLLNSFFLVFMNIVKKRDIWFNLFFLNVILYNTFLLVPYSERLNIIYGITQIIFFSHIYRNTKLPVKSQGILYMIILSYSLAIFLMNFPNGNGGIHPYKNIFY